MMTARLITVLLLCSFSAVSQTIDEINKELAQGGDSVQLLYQRAQLYTQKADYNAALNDLENIHSPDPEDQLKIDSYKILLLHQLGRVNEAKQACYDYLKLAPDDAGMHITLGEIFLSDNDPYGALGEFSWVANNHPEMAIGYIMRALIMVQLGKPDSAKRDITIVESGNVDMFNTTELSQMSTVLNMLSEHQKALNYAEKSLAKLPTPQAYALKGWALFGLKMYRESIPSLSRSIELQPSFLAYEFRGRSYFMMNDYMKAESDLKMALRVQPDIEEAYVLLGQIYKSRKNFKDACDCWQKALDINPESDVAADMETFCK